MNRWVKAVGKAVGKTVAEALGETAGGVAGKVAPPRTRGYGRLKGYLTGAAMLVAAWAAASAALRLPALPGPVEAAGALVEEVLRGELGLHLAASAGRVVASLLAALSLGLPLGLALGRVRPLDAAVSPLVYLIYPVPKIVFLPVMLALVGPGEASKLLLIAAIVFFQVLVAVRDAARSISPELVLSVTSLGGGEAELYRHVLLPAVLPGLFTALRIGLGTSIAVLFIAETFVTRFGLGYFLIDAWSRYDFPGLYAGIVAMAALGLALYSALDWAEGRACAWRAASRSG